MRAKIVVLPDAEALAREAARRFQRLAIQAVAERGRFSVALSGGSTPGALYRLLAGEPYREKIPWGNVHFFWGDERCVPPDHPGSNYRLAHETLIARLPLPPGNVHRLRGELGPEAAAQAYERDLRDYFGGPRARFDLALLGLGHDGHTASLFPGAEILAERERWAVAVTALYEDRPAQRVTLTLPALDAARQVLFLVAGSGKAGIVQKVLEGPKGDLPAQRVRPTAGRLTWLLDAAAASRLREKDANHTPGVITLVGSGEMSPTMAKVHRALMSRIAGPVRAVFLDTPAGFQLNADQISAKAIDYFRRHFDLALSVASFKSATAATPLEVENALRKLRLANYVFAGPGSPTYTIRNWRDTAILEGVTRRLASGAHLVLASAAAIAVGRYALPVYEIYKAGEEPHWVDGLDLLGPHGLELAVAPHWNNTEGGSHDTRYCFVGEPRLNLLEEQLPESATILGIDEYTACILDLHTGDGRVMGAGQVTIRQRGGEIYYPAGAAFPLEQLAGLAGAFQPCAPLGAGDERANEPPAAWDEGQEALNNDPTKVDDLVDLVVQVRAQLRAARQWALADDVRQKLSELGIVLQDGPTETTWRKE